jgi:hypothetical protein
MPPTDPNDARHFNAYPQDSVEDAIETRTRSYLQRRKLPAQLPTEHNTGLLNQLVELMVGRSKSPAEMELQRQQMQAFIHANSLKLGLEMEQLSAEAHTRLISNLHSLARTQDSPVAKKFAEALLIQSFEYNLDHHRNFVDIFNDIIMPREE